MVPWYIRQSLPSQFLSSSATTMCPLYRKQSSILGNDYVSSVALLVHAFPLGHIASPDSLLTCVFLPNRLFVTVFARLSGGLIACGEILFLFTC
ncbi:hypothetical protein BDQ17DRAFT_1355958 [Cyathus striatus]|nr:hypothetical protein BDQ17DRAFT_1355958 [Cyathus striatus]